MDRRDFLKAAAAAPLAAYLPALGEQPITASSIKAAINAMQDSWALAPNSYVMFLHPTQEKALREIAARSGWEEAYRAWRKDGRPEMTCREIASKYYQRHEWETGTFENVRLIT